MQAGLVRAAWRLEVLGLTHATGAFNMDWIKIHLAQCECNPLVSNVGALDAEVSKELRPAPSTFPLRGSVGGREGAETAATATEVGVGGACVRQ